MTSLPKRQELPVDLTWDLTHLYPTQEAFETAMTQFEKDLDTFQQHYHKKLETVSDVVNALSAYNDLHIQFDHLFNYGELAFLVDRYNKTYAKNNQSVTQLQERLNQQTAFFKPELLTLPDSIIKDVREHAEMADYLPFLDHIEREKDILFTQETESILGALSHTLFGQERLYNQWKFEDLRFDAITVDGQDIPVSFAGFEQDLEGHPNREIRQKAWKSFHNGLAKYQNVAAGNFLILVQTQKKIASLRGFDSVFDYLLFDQEMNTAGYHQIIDTLLEKWASVMRRFAKMFQAEHQIEDLSLADIKAPFLSGEPQTISVNESRALIEKALAPMGDTYQDIVACAFNERWIDYPMNDGKVTGGFCASPYQKPNYILLNWTGLLNEVLVLAHELGHAGHFTLASDNQTQLSVNPSLYFVEAPSTCNEVITCQYLLKQPLEDADKRGLLASFITSTYYHNMVTHLLEAVFQRKVYQAVDRGDVLNASVLNRFFKESLETFWGDALIINPGAELTWMRQPHYFDGLYFYTYSAGLAIGTHVGQAIATGDETVITKWLNILKQGGAKSPVDLAAMVDIDITQTTFLENTINYVESLLDQIDQLKAE